MLKGWLMGNGIKFVIAVMQENLLVENTNLECAKKLGKNDRKKATPDMEQPCDCSLPSCRQHWEVWNNMHLFHLKGNITFICNTLLNNVQKHCNFIKLIKTANKNQSRRVIWQIIHSFIIGRLPLRNIRKLYSHVWQSWIPKTIHLCLQCNIIFFWIKNCLP